MKTIINKLVIYTVTIFAVFFSCKDVALGPIDSDPTVPAKVKDVSWKALPGGVKLTYELPDDKHLSYIRAECVLKDGQVRETKASSYHNTLTLEGFPDTDNYTVNLYSVSRSEVSSEPVKQEFKPDEPHYLKVFKSLNMRADFGGATVTFANPDSASLGVTIMYIDSTGYWNDGETLYTSKDVGYVSQRGLDTVPLFSAH